MRPFEFDVQSITLTEGRLSTAVTTGALQLLLIIIFPLSFHIIGASVSEPPPGGVNGIFALYIYIYVRTSSCTVTRATRKREAGLITSVEIASASVKYKCVGREQKP